MRTSRVSATTSSVFRQEQQYLHAGDLSHNFGQNQQKQFRNRLQKNKEKTYNSTTISVNSQQQQPITPIHIDSASDLKIRRELNETALKLSRLNKQKKRLNSYRSSI